MHFEYFSFLTLNLCLENTFHFVLLHWYLLLFFFILIGLKLLLIVSLSISISLSNSFADESVNYSLLLY